VGDGPQRSDFHSHLIPGVDDGARTVEDALEGIGRMREAGIFRIVTTPHLDGSLTKKPAEFSQRLAEMDDAYARLHKAVSAEYGDVDLQRGHEVMLDVPDPDLSDQRLHLGDTNFVLIEWPRLSIPPGTVEAIERLVSQGIRPIVAHPERYRGIAERFRLTDLWRQHGALLQVNYGSLVGRYGASPRALAFRLLERGWVDCLSTDFHGRPHLELYVQQAEEAFGARGAEEQFAILSSVNTKRILDGHDPIEVPPLPPDRRLWSRLRGLLRSG
jgi:protein-tyrosine phosphatase